MGEERTLFPVMKTPRLNHPLLPVPYSSTLGPSQLPPLSPFSCPPSLPYPTAPNGQFSQKRLFPSRISISESRGNKLISRVYCIIHAVRTCTESTARVAVVLLPNHRCTTRKRLQGIRHQHSISPRTIAKFICEKIHCNVLFKVPLPPKACGFSYSFEIYMQFF